MNNRVLVVEDSLIFRNYLAGQLSQINMQVVLTESLAEARAVLEKDTDFLCTVLDFCLPDGPNGEIIDLALSYQMKVIVITAYFDEAIRDSVLAKGAIDYILKDSMASVSYLLPLLKRLNRNKYHKALVVDDSTTIRNHLTQLLAHQYIDSIQAEDGYDALDKLAQNSDITLIITDQVMPKKDGITLVREVRQRYDYSQLAIVGISSADSSTLTARFLKAGANDYLKKPFNQEEFYCRIHTLLDMKDISDDMYRMANQDSLTNLWNRRYLFNHVDSSHEQCNVAMLDIDKFKKINDTYGHSGGDQALITVSNIISIYFKDDLVARFGGEEFCIVNYGDYDAFVQRLDSMRQRMEKTTIQYKDQSIKLTVSIGCSQNSITTNEQTTQDSDTETEGSSIDAMIRVADDRLYIAKESGRNQTISIG